MNKKYLVLVSVIFFIGAGLALNTVLTGYRVDSGQFKVISAHSITKKVTNNCANGIFIPTKTEAEFQSLVDHKPSCVSLTVAMDTFTYPRTTDGQLIGSDSWSGNGHTNKEDFADYYCLIHGFDEADSYYYESGAGRRGCRCVANYGCGGESCWSSAPYILRTVTCSPGIGCVEEPCLPGDIWNEDMCRCVPDFVHDCPVDECWDGYSCVPIGSGRCFIEPPILD